MDKQSMVYTYLETFIMVNFMLHIFYDKKDKAKARLALLILDKVDFRVFQWFSIVL